MNELIDTFLEITYFRTMVVKEVHLLYRAHRTWHGRSKVKIPKHTLLSFKKQKNDATVKTNLKWTGRWISISSLYFGIHVVDKLSLRHRQCFLGKLIIKLWVGKFDTKLEGRKKTWINFDPKNFRSRQNENLIAPRVLKKTFTVFCSSPRVFDYFRAILDLSISILVKIASSLFKKDLKMSWDICHCQIWLGNVGT